MGLELGSSGYSDLTAVTQFPTEGWLKDKDTTILRNVGTAAVRTLNVSMN
jgi:hypothetical protein